ncbi:MAG: hypothetical protein IT249_18150 [Chitinophagaceae bacterium]|nr:hypothetical protein [Chitinophagaceae bacterium]
MKTNIMLVTNNTSMFGNIENELNRKDVEWYITDSSENAIEKFQQSGIDIVFLHNNMDATDKRKLQKIFNLFDENINIVEIDSNANVATTIANALNNQMKNNFSFIDDALVNAKFNISVAD